MYRRATARQPTAYEGVVRARPADRALPHREWPVVWRTGHMRLRTLAALLAQAEVLRLRIELLAAAEREHKEAAARAAHAVALRPVLDTRGAQVGWMPAAFTMKGRRHTDEAKAKMRAAAKASWAKGDRPRPTWLQEPRAALVDEPRPVRREPDPAEPSGGKVIPLRGAKGKR